MGQRHGGAEATRSVEVERHGDANGPQDRTLHGSKPAGLQRAAQGPEPNVRFVKGGDLLALEDRCRRQPTLAPSEADVRRRGREVRGARDDEHVARELVPDVGRDDEHRAKLVEVRQVEEPPAQIHGVAQGLARRLRTTPSYATRRAARLDALAMASSSLRSSPRSER